MTYKINGEKVRGIMRARGVDELYLSQVSGIPVLVIKQLIAGTRYARGIAVTRIAQVLGVQWQELVDYGGTT